MKNRSPLSEDDWRKVFRARCISKRGFANTDEDQALVERAFREDRKRYADMEVDIFNETIPFGSTVRRSK